MSKYKLIIFTAVKLNILFVQYQNKGGEIYTFKLFFSPQFWSEHFLMIVFDYLNLCCKSFQAPTLW